MDDELARRFSEGHVEGPGLDFPGLAARARYRRRVRRAVQVLGASCVIVAASIAVQTTGSSTPTVVDQPVEPTNLERSPDERTWAESIVACLADFGIEATAVAPDTVRHEHSGSEEAAAEAMTVCEGRHPRDKLE